MKTFILILSMLLIGCSCGMQESEKVYKDPVPVPVPVPLPNPNPGVLNFVSDVKPILTQNCALRGCHANAPFLDNQRDFLSSNSIRRITNGTMPPDYSPKYDLWDDTKRTKILNWYETVD